MLILRYCFGVFFLLGALCSSSCADTLVLKNGNKYNGVLVAEADKYYTFEVEGEKLTYWKDEVKEVRVEEKKARGAYNFSDAEKKDIAMAFKNVKDKNYSAALGTLRKLSVKYPEYIPFQISLGLCYYCVGKPQEAIRTVKSLIDDYPDLSSAYGILGLSYRRLGNMQAGAEALKKFSELIRSEGEKRNSNQIVFISLLIDELVK